MQCQPDLIVPVQSRQDHLIPRNTLKTPAIPHEHLHNMNHRAANLSRSTQSSIVMSTTSSLVQQSFTALQQGPQSQDLSSQPRILLLRLCRLLSRLLHLSHQLLLLSLSPKRLNNLAQLSIKLLIEQLVLRTALLVELIETLDFVF